MINIFIDFDGTITTQDVGDAMFETFGGRKCLDFIGEYRDGDISAVECFRRECAECTGTDKNALDTFLDSQKIDSTFSEFLEFCSTNKFQYFVLSDGMDYYIDRILSRHQITGVSYFSNHLDLVPMNGDSKIMFQPSFPFTDETCDRCACCKRNKMLTLSADEDVIIYIGEGYSDRCPVRYADIVFAKDELLNYCRRENISYFEYRTFADVMTRLKSMAENKQTKKHFGLKKHRQAQLAARELFIGE
jgi:2-hydroxy-3-keto-5-methylthiopentenyl-1-phosphate phosphatase